MNHTVSNFPPIPLHCSHLLATEVLFGVNVKPYVVASFSGELVYKRFPNLLAVFICEVWVVELNVNARDKRVVKRTNSVRGQEENSVIELQGAEEPCSRPIMLAKSEIPQ